MKDIEKIKKEYGKTISHYTKEYKQNRQTNVSLHTSAEKLLMGMRK